MIVHNIKGITSPLAAESNFGRKIELNNEVKAWKSQNEVKTGYLSCKRRSWKVALREFKKLYNVKEFFIACPDQTANWSDDSITISYTTKD